MKCKICQAEIDDNSKFCPSCGNVVEPETGQTYDQEIIEPQGEDKFHFEDGSAGSGSGSQNDSFYGGAGYGGSAGASQGFGYGGSGGSDREWHSYCTNCGKPISPNAFICPNCGAKVGRDPRGYVPKTVSFTEAFALYWKNYFNFSGRATVREFWYVVLWQIIINFAISIITDLTGASLISTYLLSQMIGQEATVQISILAIIIYAITELYSLALIIPDLSIAIRRLHDTGRSGFWLFIVLLPLVGWIILLVLLCGQSQPFRNRYDK